MPAGRPPRKAAVHLQPRVPRLQAREARAPWEPLSVLWREEKVLSATVNWSADGLDLGPRLLLRRTKPVTVRSAHPVRREGGAWGGGGGGREPGAGGTGRRGLPI